MRLILLFLAISSCAPVAGNACPGGTGCLGQLGSPDGGLDGGPGPDSGAGSTQPLPDGGCRAYPNASLCVELRWQSGVADLDLHLLRIADDRGDLADAGWFNRPLDCYDGNASPDWGQHGPSGNPILDVDGDENHPFEYIVIPQAESSVMRVGVHSFCNRSAETNAHLRVFCEGSLLLETASTMPATGGLWEAATIRWPECSASALATTRLGFGGMCGF